MPIAYSLLAAVLLQALVHLVSPSVQLRAATLPEPWPATILRVGSMNESIALSKLLMLYLQAFDNQPGISIPFKNLDYVRVEAWLARILELDPRGQYPLLSASHLYASVPDPGKQRRMLEFVHHAFLADPDRRWPWLAHAVVLAKHQLRDLPLAARYAQALRVNATATSVPSWARQMEIFLREDMNETESAKVLLGGLLASGQVTDAHELRFLADKLERLERKSQ